MSTAVIDRIRAENRITASEEKKQVAGSPIELSATCITELEILFTNIYLRLKREGKI